MLKLLNYYPEGLVHHEHRPVFLHFQFPCDFSAKAESGHLPKNTDVNNKSTNLRAVKVFFNSNQINVSIFNNLHAAKPTEAARFKPRLPAAAQDWWSRGDGRTDLAEGAEDQRQTL